jgi:hypothetical protein
VLEEGTVTAVTFKTFKFEMNSWLIELMFRSRAAG